MSKLKGRLNHEKIARDRGFKMLSEYIDPLSKVKYECPKGHVVQMTPFGLSQNKHGCGLCYREYRASLDTTALSVVEEVAHKAGYNLLSKSYSYGKKLEVQCKEKGHIKEISYNSLKKGQRCASCLGRGKHSLDYVRSAFDKAGFTLLATEYVNGRTKMAALCTKGHQTKVTFTYLQQQGRGNCKTCADEMQKGANSPRWDASKTPAQRAKEAKAYRGKLATRWARSVKKRDDGICGYCNSAKKNMTAHHLNNWKFYPEQRYLLSNGVTLCRRCHVDFHKIYGKTGNTISQYESWLNQRK